MINRKALGAETQFSSRAALSICKAVGSMPKTNDLLAFRSQALHMLILTSKKAASLPTSCFISILKIQNLHRTAPTKQNYV